MPAYKRQLKDRNDDIIYPLTTAESVVDEDGVDLQTRVEDAAYIGTGSVGTLSPWVDTSDIVDGAVTATKLDYTTNGATAIPANSDLNTTSFITPGRYVCRRTADAYTLSNCPTSQAFNMTVINALSGVADISDTSLWMYFVRIIIEYTGTMYVQEVRNNGTSTWTYGAWEQIINSNITTGTFSMESGFAELSNRSFIRKVGNLVTWQLFFTATSAMSAGTEYHVGTISSGFRPPQLTLGSGSVTNGVNIGSFVDEDGKIRLIPYANVASNSSRYVGGTYFVN